MISPNLDCLNQKTQMTSWFQVENQEGGKVFSVVWTKVAKLEMHFALPKCKVLLHSWFDPDPHFILNQEELDEVD